MGGPVTSWWIIGYGAGETAVAGISTDHAHYSLVDPSDAYVPMLQTFNAKVQMSKIIVDRLTEADQMKEQVRSFWTSLSSPLNQAWFPLPFIHPPI